jgi:hypothetical protein
MDLIFNRLVNLMIVALGAHLCLHGSFHDRRAGIFGAILFLFGGGFALAQNWRHASAYDR